LVEQGIENPRVGGSIPSLGTTIQFQVVPGIIRNAQKTGPSAGFLLPAFWPGNPFPALEKTSSSLKPP
jgi:hypothetical protein